MSNGKNWKPYEVDCIKKHYGTLGAKEIGLIIGRNKNQVIGKAFRLGLSVNRSLWVPILEANRDWFDGRWLLVFMTKDGDEHYEDIQIRRYVRWEGVCGKSSMRWADKLSNIKPYTYKITHVRLLPSPPNIKETI